MDQTSEKRGKEVAGEKAAKLRIIVASNIRLYREGLAASVAVDGRVEVAALTDLEEALKAAVRLEVDAVVLDASTADGRALARRAKASNPELPMVGFGISDSAADVIACAESGLVGFIGQDGSVEALVTAVTEAARGEFSCSPRITTILCSRLARLANRSAPAGNSLTPREMEIAGMIAEGFSNKEIAQGLRIGPATVKNHVHNILDKLHVRRRSAIAGRMSSAELR